MTAEIGDLFLRHGLGHIHQLDVAIGKLTKVADSEKQVHDWLSQSRGRKSGLQSQMKRRRLLEDWNQMTISTSDLASHSLLLKAALLIPPMLLTSRKTAPFLET